MAAWVIGYGLAQSLALYITGLKRSHPPSGTAAWKWASVLAAVPVAMAWLFQAGGNTAALLVAGLALFGLLFAMNSSLHSYPIAAFAERDGVSQDVGFYYMANALGRLIGTVLSGWVFQQWGLAACLMVSGVFVALAAAISLNLPATAAQD